MAGGGEGWGHAFPVSVDEQQQMSSSLSLIRAHTLVLGRARLCKGLLPACLPAQTGLIGHS